MAVPSENVRVWLGPCIGPKAFEVGQEVRAMFVAHEPSSAAHFHALPKPAAGDHAVAEPKFLCDLVAIAAPGGAGNHQCGGQRSLYIQ